MAFDLKHEWLVSFAPKPFVVVSVRGIVRETRFPAYVVISQLRISGSKAQAETSS
ncbi:MAG: hypothetical protein HUJ27_10600 [Rhodobacteraceae bacterium]|nr:hypothetical protein [Paracoccaceae bacterium]